MHYACADCRKPTTTTLKVKRNELFTHTQSDYRTGIFSASHCALATRVSDCACRALRTSSSCRYATTVNAPASQIRPK